MPLIASEIAPLVKCPVLATGMDRSDHRGMVKTLADLPRLFLRRHAVLQIAPRHVEAERVAVDVIERLLRRDVGAAGFQRRHEFDLVVIVFGERGIWMIHNRAGRDKLDRVGRLLEEERRLAGRIGAALDRMRGVIAPDAIDAANRKHLFLARNRNRHRGHVEYRLWAALGVGRAARGRGPASASAPVASRVLRSTVFIRVLRFVLDIVELSTAQPSGPASRINLKTA